MESFKNRITYPVVIRNSGHHPEARPALHRRTRNRLSKTIEFGPQNTGPDVVVIFSYNFSMLKGFQRFWPQFSFIILLKNGRILKIPLVLALRAAASRAALSFQKGVGRRQRYRAA